LEESVDFTECWPRRWFSGTFWYPYRYYIVRKDSFLATININFKYFLVPLWYRGGLRQVKFYIDEERYEELKKLAQEQGLSVPGYVKRLVLKHLGEMEGSVEENVEYLLQMQEQMRKELGRIGLDLIKLQKRVEYLEQYLRGETSTRTNTV